jgi:lipoprotein LprG
MSRRRSLSGRLVAAGGPALLTGFLSLALLAGACNSSSKSSTPKVSATQLLEKSKATVDAATSAHFGLTSSNVPHSGTNLLSGQGDLARPNSLRGSFSVAVSGFAANVQVVAVGDVFMAKLPFTSHYLKTNPSNYGLANPAELLDPDKGLSNLLTLAQNPSLGPSQLVAGEHLDTVTYTVPGSEVPVLPNANPSQPVRITVAINPTSYELRVVTIVGPLINATSDSTYVVTLTNYNEHVNITLPTSG